MGKHSRGRHRAPGRDYRKAALSASGAFVAVPLLMTATSGTALAAPPGGWDAVIQCESGGNPKAQNRSSTASGLFQFLDSTWRGLGGKGRAKDASVAEQYRMADKLYAQSGLRPWTASRSCWAGKRNARPAPKPERVLAAAAPRVRVAPRAPGTGTYTVRPGDTLTKIAAVRGTTWRALAAKNAVKNPNLIFAGAQLQI